jgi:hypothetical protein
MKEEKIKEKKIFRVKRNRARGKTEHHFSLQRMD